MKIHSKRLSKYAASTPSSDAVASPKACNVAIGVIFDADLRVLITKRPHHVPHGGQWEFPGGKIEQGEFPIDALKREIQEEVGLIITEAALQEQFAYHYPKQLLQIFVFFVAQYHGIPMRLAEQLDLRWVKPEKLSAYSFPEANKDIIAKINECKNLIDNGNK